jgi:hypothetical protein
MIEINKNPSQRELAWFGVLCMAFFGLVGLSVLRKTHELRDAGIVWGIAAVAVAVYFVAPPLRRPVYVGWMYAVYPLSWVISHALLAIIFFGVITPIGLVMRLVSRDSLGRALDRSAASYWTPHDPGSDVDRYFRQF